MKAGKRQEGDMSLGKRAGKGLEGVYRRANALNGQVAVPDNQRRTRKRGRRVQARINLLARGGKGLARMPRVRAVGLRSDIQLFPREERRRREEKGRTRWEISRIQAVI